MIEEINIKDLGVIKDAKLTFTSGLTCLTGETGAGKTMVLTALGLLLGNRSDVNIIRKGANAASVEGCWNVPEGNAANSIVDEAGGEVENGQLYINRTVSNDGKSKASVGGKGTPASVLTKVGDSLVSIHGQSDQIRLKSATAQREALDSFSPQINEALKAYQNVYTSWKTLSAEVEDIKNNMAARQREFDELTVAVNDISKVEPTSGEDVRLKEQVERLSNLEVLRDAAASALNRIASDDYDSTDVISLLGEAAKILDNVAEFDSKMGSIFEQVEVLKIQANETVSELSGYLENIDMDSIIELNNIQERIAALNSLVRKYGPTLDDVIKLYDEGSLRLDKLDPENSNVEILEKELNVLFESMKTAAEVLHSRRTAAAKEICLAVNEELKGLAMGGSSLHVNVTNNSTYTQHGADDIVFLLQPHAGSEPRPLGKGASGGELSRIMLALEVVLADPESTPTFIFDEVDSGVGGSSAIEIGKRLAKLAKEAQVIVVTHLPQVAAFADNHLRVLKNVDGSFTATDVATLTDDERVVEISRMLSGLDNSDSGQEHARELVEFAESYKTGL